jgi:hypothetical protein
VNSELVGPPGFQACFHPSCILETLSHAKRGPSGLALLPAPRNTPLLVDPIADQRKVNHPSFLQQDTGNNDIVNPSQAAV